jgi:Cys-tRNA synthase (O-phospho-L-seryl-tRNA:Cys-tRNA synthase)
MKFSHTHCIEHIPDTNYWHYALQLNTYKALIEKNYNKKVTSMVLVCLYPDNKSYQLIKVPDLSEEINDLFNLRRYILHLKENNNL